VGIFGFTTGAEYLSSDNAGQTCRRMNYSVSGSRTRHDSATPYRNKFLP